MMPPQTARMGGNRSGGVSPVPSPLRSTYLLGEARPALGVEGGDSPPSVRLTALGAALLGVITALVFCLAVWACLWLLGTGYFITALVGVTVAYIATAIFRKK